jgi:hypothetical protein
VDADEPGGDHHAGRGSGDEGPTVFTSTAHASRNVAAAHVVDAADRAAGLGTAVDL